VPGLELRLWGGFSRSAGAELAALTEAADAPPRAAAEAALALARWHGAAGDFGTALGLAGEARRRCPRLAADRRHYLLEALFLCRTGRGAEARALLDTRARGFDPAASLLRADSWDPVAEPERVLAEVNAVFRRFGLSGIARRDPAAPLGLDNLRGEAEPGTAAGPLVTVIVPVWNAAATLATALRSLAEQTHPALEILVVDDGSTDASAEIAADFARADPRFRLLRQGENRGGYAARNRALAEAAGEFVTVQDADDWSHPERIARHLADLVRRDLPFNRSDWTRATTGLRFWGPWRPSPNLVSPNFSSVFFRRALVAHCGPWDTARVSADREFAARLERLHGLPPQPALLPGCPLAFGRDAGGSLTRAPATHAATLLHGIRREYREAAALWHGSLDPASLRATGWRAAPPFFPAPRILRNAEPGGAHDLLFIADFNLRGGAFHSAFNMIRAGLAAGLDCAALHYRRYDLDPSRPLDAGFRRFAAEAGVRIVAPGERLRAATVIVTYPAVFDHAMDRFPAVDHDRLAVVVNQMAERDVAGTDPAYDPLRVRTHLAEVFGGEGLWIPNSERVRQLMAADPRYPAPHSDIWMPLRDLASWCARTPRWRGAERTRPVLGRHGRDHPLKWPPDPAMLRAAYCAGRPCEVRFLGGARHARARARRWPRNWRVEPFGARDVQAFLAELDIFLHYPDPAYIEEFGGAAMEAMAVGVPVVLAPELAPIYGEAALYAAPDEVWPLVERLWRDQGFWEARVAAGRAFVRENCGYDVFPGRLARLAAVPARAEAAAAPA
jgi:glycosyltransferase involved in cell wall biosynthesis